MSIPPFLPLATILRLTPTTHPTCLGLHPNGHPCTTILPLEQRTEADRRLATLSWRLRFEGITQQDLVDPAQRLLCITHRSGRHSQVPQLTHVWAWELEMHFGDPGPWARRAPIFSTGGVQTLPSQRAGGLVVMVTPPFPGLPAIFFHLHSLDPAESGPIPDDDEAAVALQRRNHELWEENQQRRRDSGVQEITAGVDESSINDDASHANATPADLPIASAPLTNSTTPNKPDTPLTTDDTADNTDDTAEDCPICLDPMPHNTDLVACRAQCGRRFHRSCMAMWAEGSRSHPAASFRCPLCRGVWVWTTSGVEL